ncbi:hypothetical protein [Bradyrhizobium sp. UFLA05-112]
MSFAALDIPQKSIRPSRCMTANGVTALLSIFALSATDALGEECGCRFQKARSESTIGTCAVREDMARDCDLVWGAPAGSKEANAGPSDNDAIFSDLTKAANAGRSPDADKFAPGASGMSDPGFWNQFRNEVRRRSQIPDGAKASTFDHALAFLANQGATSDFRQYTLAAIIFTTATNLSQGRIDPELRLAIVTAMMSNRDKLTAFASGGSEPSQFTMPLTVKSPVAPSNQVTLNGQVTRGCFDIWTEVPTVGSLVKAPWASVKGGRC